MGWWVRRDATQFIPRKSPQAMEAFTGEVHTDVDDQGIDNANWLFNDPGAASLFAASVPLKYWMPDGAGSIREATGAEKVVIDAGITAGQDQDVLDRLNAEVELVASAGDGGVRVRSLLNAFLVQLNGALARIVELQQDLQAIKASQGGVDSVRAAVRTSYLPVTPRTLRQLLNDYKADLPARKNPEP